nr:hypothetical protein [Tanacetum cinerariifolium]
KVKDGVGYNVVPPHTVADLYLSPKKYLSWTGLPEFVDDIITDYSRPSSTVASTSAEGQNKNSTTFEDVASPNTPKPFVKFVKPKDSQSKSPKFVLKKKACFHRGDFSHLANECRKRVQRETTRNNPPVNRKFSSGRRNFPTVNRKFPTASRTFTTSSTKIHTPDMGMKGKAGSSQNNVDDKGYWDSGCSRHMTGNISYLYDFEPFDGGYVSFGQGGCKITGNGTIKTDKLEFENVYFVKDLKYNLFKCIVLGRNFKLLDDANILLKIPRQHNMYSIDLNNIVLHKDLTCLVAKASADECILWHRRLVDAGTNSTNFSSTKDAASQEVKKDVSSLRYIALPNWVHDALLESSSSKPQDGCNPKVPEGSGNTNPTASTSNPPTAQMETLTVKIPIPTVSSPVLTACLNDSPEPSSDARLISKRVANQEETPSLDNILSLINRFEYILGVTTRSDEAIGAEADVSNMETTILASPTPTLRIHKHHPKSLIIGPVDTLIQTRHKSKEVEEQSFIATIYQKTDPALLQFCLFSCFLSQVEPKKIFDALPDPSWVEAMQEELLQFKIQNVWTLVDCPKGVRPIWIKWVLKNKKDERGIV